ncbi:MAG TPA: hypothetical protein VKV73_24590 [Chloroflexota bacterium]|nr:hypothetical protein [Chloroflexota bacterium]
MADRSLALPLAHLHAPGAALPSRGTPWRAGAALPWCGTALALPWRGTAPARHCSARPGAALPWRGTALARHALARHCLVRHCPGTALARHALARNAPQRGTPWRANALVRTPLARHCPRAARPGAAILLRGNALARQCAGAAMPSRGNALARHAFDHGQNHRFGPTLPHLGMERAKRCGQQRLSSGAGWPMM